jgi:hypothetical protein
MSRAKTFAGVLTLVLLASCGSSTKKAAPAAPPVSAAIVTTAASTTAPTTTVPAPTVPVTTLAPTTTTMSLKDLEKVVRQAHQEYWVAARLCIGAPASCDPSPFTAVDSPARARLVESTKALVEKNWIGRRNESDPSVAVIDSIAFNKERTVATLQECLWDTGIAVQPGAGPNGEDIIVDDGKGSFDITVTMVLSNGKWLTSDRKQLALHDGVNLCAGR